MKVKSEIEVAQLCPTLSDPMDCSLPGSSIHGIFQARVLEWGAIAFSTMIPYFQAFSLYVYLSFSPLHMLAENNDLARSRIITLTSKVLLLYCFWLFSPLIQVYLKQSFTTPPWREFKESMILNKLPRWHSCKESPCQCRNPRRCGFDPLEEEMATHSNILAWKISWTEEPDGL